MLGRGKKVIARHVRVELLLDNPLHKFGKGRDNGDGTEVGCLGGVARFVDGMDNRVFPGFRILTGCETGVD